VSAGRNLDAPSSNLVSEVNLIRSVHVNK
jgi:hypothetical protein